MKSLAGGPSGGGFASDKDVWASVVDGVVSEESFEASGAIVDDGTGALDISTVDVSDGPSSAAPEQAAATSAKDARTRKMRFTDDTLPVIPVYGIAFGFVPRGGHRSISSLIRAVRTSTPLLPNSSLTTTPCLMSTDTG